MGPGKIPHSVKIPATLQPLLDASPRAAPSLLKALQIGQILDAKVLGQPQAGLLRLQIAALELLARTELRATPGTLLRLEVTKGQPLPELRVLPEPTDREYRQQVVRTAMIRQLPPAEVRQVLAELRGTPLAARQNEAVRQLTAILQDAGLRTARPAPAEVQRAVARSGLFHEARLAGVLPPDPADTKTRLLQLLSLLSDKTRPPAQSQRPQAAGGEAPPPAREPAGDSLLSRLVRLIEGSVSRIQLQQAVALPGDEGQRQAWQIDLPIQLRDETHEAMLRIEREAEGRDGDGQAAWAVNLVFRFDSIGALHCRIGLAGERVSTTFWCDRRNTLERLEPRLPMLQQAFEAQGLEVAHLAGVLGEPPQPLIRVPMPDTLLDERA